MRNINAKLLTAFAVLGCGLRVVADSWALPEPAKYYSENKRYYVEVIPRKLESRLKFFEDKVAKKDPSGSRKGLKDNYCKGVFYRRGEDGQYEKVWESRLSNDVAPVAALVSDGGEYVVTFDNWHSVGYGDDVVVIYGGGGQLMRKMGLSDIVPPNTPLPRSVSSIWWGGMHYIDEKNLQLVLKVITKWSGSPGDEDEFRDVRVDLATGELVKANAVAE